MNQKATELETESARSLDRIGFELGLPRRSGERNDAYFERLRCACTGSGEFSINEIPTLVQGKTLKAV